MIIEGVRKIETAEEKTLRELKDRRARHKKFMNKNNQDDIAMLRDIEELIREFELKVKSPTKL